MPSGHGGGYTLTHIQIYIYILELTYIYIYIYINIKEKNYIDRIIVKESTIKNKRNKVTYSNTKQTRQNKAKKKSKDENL